MAGYCAGSSMRYVAHILIVMLAGGAAAQTNSLPPMPGDGQLVYGSTNYTLAGVAPLPPGDPAPEPREPRRVIREDRHCFLVSTNEITWYFSQPIYVVEHCSSLVSNDWKSVAVVDGTNYVHQHAEGFYRVRQIKRPTPPPTLPPVDMPTNVPPDTAAISTNEIRGFLR